MSEEKTQASDGVASELNAELGFEDKEPIFEQMRLAGIPPTEKIPSAKFLAMAKKLISQDGFFDMPQIERAVECVGC